MTRKASCCCGACSVEVRGRARHQCHMPLQQLQAANRQRLRLVGLFRRRTGGRPEWRFPSLRHRRPQSAATLVLRRLRLDRSLESRGPAASDRHCRRLLRRSAAGAASVDGVERRPLPLARPAEPTGARRCSTRPVVLRSCAAVTTLLALLPLLLVLGLLASGRAERPGRGPRGPRGHACGLARHRRRSARAAHALGGLFLRETAAGLWLSWHVIAIIAAGMFFHRCQQARGTAANGGAPRRPIRGGCGRSASCWRPSPNR